MILHETLLVLAYINYLILFSVCPWCWIIVTVNVNFIGNYKWSNLHFERKWIVWRTSLGRSIRYCLCNYLFLFWFLYLCYICCMLQSLVHCLDRYCWNLLELHYFKMWLDGKIVHWFPMNWKNLLSASFAHQFLLSLFSPGYNQFCLVPSFWIVLQCLFFIVTFSDIHYTRIDFRGNSFSSCYYDMIFYQLHARFCFSQKFTCCYFLLIDNGRVMFL